jgi:galactose mutarotase-like enzyme
LGAELCSLKNNTKTEFIWEGNPEFWGKHSPILFPIVGTLKNNSFFYDNQEYKLTRHGFAREMEFELVEKGNNYATFSLKSSLETLILYPFKFELQITYRLEEMVLSIEYKVLNKSETRIPFSIGAHPAFALVGNFENYSIEFEQEEPLKYFALENDLISNKTKKLATSNRQVSLNYSLFENDALVFKSIVSKSLAILKDSKPILKINFEDFPSLGIWTKKNASFICIEPWFGYSDTETNFGNILEKEGILVLEYNETFNSKFSIKIF